MLKTCFRFRPALSTHIQTQRQFSLWKKFVPRFGKDKKEEEKAEEGPGLVPSSKDELRKKILDAELEEVLELGKKPQEEWISNEIQREREQKIQQEELNEQMAAERDEAVENLTPPPIYSIQEIITTTEEQDDGTVTLPLLLENNEPKSFENMEKYQKWLDDKQEEILMHNKAKLTPHEFFITQGKGMERAFTGKYWWVKDVGTYSCKVCTQKLFISEHKYDTNNGYANFWNHVLDSVSFREDSLKNHETRSDQAYIEKKFRDKFPEKRAI